MKLSFNKEKLEEIKDPAPGRKEYYDKSKGKTTPLNQNAGDILKRIQGGNSSFEDAVSASIAKQQTTGANQVSAGNGKGVGVLSGAAAMRSSQAAGAVPGSGGDISELSDRVSALEGGQASAQPDGEGAIADVSSGYKGGAFPTSAQNAAMGMFGTQDQRQQSVAQQPI